MCLFEKPGIPHRNATWGRKKCIKEPKMDRRIIFTALFFCKTSRHCKGLSLEASAVYFNAIIISSGQCFKAESCLHNHFLPFLHGKELSQKGTNMVLTYNLEEGKGKGCSFLFKWEIMEIDMIFRTNVLIFLPDWVLKTDQDLDGIPLSYIDMLERSESEERRRDREVQIMQEGKWVISCFERWTTWINKYKRGM